jgi:hypothetical protein
MEEEGRNQHSGKSNFKEDENKRHEQQCEDARESHIPFFQHSKVGWGVIKAVAVAC